LTNGTSRPLGAGLAVDSCRSVAGTPAQRRARQHRVTLASVERVGGARRWSALVERVGGARPRKNRPQRQITSNAVDTQRRETWPWPPPSHRRPTGSCAPTPLSSRVALATSRCWRIRSRCFNGTSSKTRRGGPISTSTHRQASVGIAPTPTARRASQAPVHRRSQSGVTRSARSLAHFSRSHGGRASGHDPTRRVLNEAKSRRSQRRVVRPTRHPRL